jgi:uncharacterized protein
MIVVDASIFIDLIFEYSTERTRSAEELFSILEKDGMIIVEPDIFRIELAGQTARRIRKDLAPKICDEIFLELDFVCTSNLFDTAFDIALKTGSRAIDSFYIATAKVKDAILISNDKFQVGSAKEFGIEVYNLLQDREQIRKKLQEIAL